MFSTAKVKMGGTKKKLKNNTPRKEEKNEGPRPQRTALIKYRQQIKKDDVY